MFIFQRHAFHAFLTLNNTVSKSFFSVSLSFKSNGSVADRRFAGSKGLESGLSKPGVIENLNLHACEEF